MDWKKIVSTVAPLLGTALGGPLGGLALKTLGEALGLDEHTEEAISAAITGASPELLLKIKQADQQFAKDMKVLDVDIERIAAADRGGAREMQIQTRAKTPAVLSWVIVIAALGLEGYIMMAGIPTAVPDVVAGRILGTLDASLLTVITFWLGAAHQTSGVRSSDAHR